jgi:hypothetical protein
MIMGLFTAMFGKSATSLSEHVVEDYSTWEREAHASIPDINLDNCSFEQYKEYQSATRLANTFTNPGENSTFLEEGKTYIEHLEECYEKDVLKRGFLGLW